MNAITTMTTEQALHYLTLELINLDLDDEYSDLVTQGMNALLAINNSPTFEVYRATCNSAEALIAELRDALIGM